MSGTIVETERASHYFARDPLKPEVVCRLPGHLHRRDGRIPGQRGSRDERDRLLWSRVLPITFTAAGGRAGRIGLFASFSLRTEGALMAASGDQDDHDYGGFEETGAWSGG